MGHNLHHYWLDNKKTFESMIALPWRLYSLGRLSLYRQWITSPIYVQAFLQLAIGRGHLHRQTRDHLQEDSISIRTPPTQESFLVTPPPDQSPPLQGFYLYKKTISVTTPTIADCSPHAYIRIGLIRTQEGFEQPHPARLCLFIAAQGLHREIQGMAEQMRIINKNNAFLIQHLTMNNPPPPPAALVLEVQRFRRLQRTDEVMCKAFSTTLEGFARSWFRKLPPGTVDLFGPLFDSLSKNVPDTLSTLQSKDDKDIAMEELTKVKRRRQGRDDYKRKEPDSKRTDHREEARNRRSDFDSRRKTNERCPRTPPRCPKLVLPPLNAPIAQVLTEIKHEEFIKWLGKIKTDPCKKNKNKYCEFHRDHKHNTQDCFQLKEQIVDLIKKGYLRKYIADCQ
ncbi:hypothetical protein Acr_00g0100920 [Actinidia rufa]|uniref:Retrotransposon gag domain-containing protein n=1 Tax=Actinidia rufa TaxID=165716 RepID=A0A7J0E2B7_9ERIC|nr:hypothetical protein Acr_00g0100920 [Actinidia rufa]